MSPQLSDSGRDLSLISNFIQEGMDPTVQLVGTHLNSAMVGNYPLLAVLEDFELRSPWNIVLTIQAA